MPPAAGEERKSDDVAADRDAPTLSPRTPAPSDAAEPGAPPQSERYEIGALLGQGGMGKVYKAFDRKLKRPVALKFLRAADAQLESRFLQEAQAQARVEHAFVCRVYEAGRIGELPYIAMQYIDGQTLREAAKAMTVAEKVAVLRDVAEAVHAAHGQGLIHRDIKPANILIGKAPGSPPSICDFGLARDLDQPGTTQQGALLGTPQYMAPEQARGEHEALDARTDVYGLGATLYEALTGRPPFEGKSNLQTLYKMMHEEPTPPRRLVPSLPVDLESVVLKCLEKKQSSRYPTARALAEELQRTLDGEPVQARRASALERALRRMRRNKALSAALLALVLVGLAPFGLALLDRGGHVTVAVADFDNQTGERDLDGLSGMLITSLEQSRRLTVLTRSRMFDLLQQLGKPEGTRIDEALGREVAQKAGAQALVLSTIRKFDALYVVELRVLDPRSGETVVAVKEQGTGKSSLPRLIDQLSSQARRSLKEPFALTAAPVADVTTRDLQAYEHYFKGEQLIDRLHFTAAAVEDRAALAIDPSFALASYRLAYSLMWMYDAPRAREAIDRALLQPRRLPEKERLMARGVRASMYGRGKEAYDAYLECETRFPTEKECVFMVGDVVFHGGYFSYSIEHFHKALALDPTMERAWQHLLWADQLLGKDELPLDARQYVARTGTPESYAQLGRALAARGQLQEAAATLETARTLFPHSPVPAGSAGALDAFRFDIDGAVRELKPLAGDPSLSAHERAGAGVTLGGALTQGGRIREALQAYGDAAKDARAGGDVDLEATAIASEALDRLLFLRDAAGARKLMSDASARGVPETWFGFVYPLLGDLDKYASVLKSSGDPLVDQSVAAFTARVKGDPLAAAQGLEALAGKSPYQDFIFYVVSDSYAQAHDDARAIEKLKHAQDIFPSVTAPGPGFAGVFRARSDDELGRLYERTQQLPLALEATRRFLRAWDKADPDLPELKDARARAERLAATGKIELR